MKGKSSIVYKLFSVVANIRISLEPIRASRLYPKLDDTRESMRLPLARMEYFFVSGAAA